MEDVLAYLELKNRYYEKFLRVTEKFLTRARENSWDGLELFVENRERILNIIRSFDFKIAGCFEKVKLTNADIERLRPQVKGLLDRREVLVSKIVSMDLEMIQTLEHVKSETIRELKKSISVSHQMQTFSEVGEVLLPRKTVKHSA